MAVARLLFGFCSMCSRILLISSLIRLISKRITLTQTLNRFQSRDGIQNWFVHNCQRQDIFVSYFLDNLFVRTFQSHTSTSHECGRCFHDVPKNPQNNRMFLKSWRKINWIYEQENEQCTERWSYVSTPPPFPFARPPHFAKHSNTQIFSTEPIQFECAAS